ncbi:MAG: substrate-binding domain-containing protein, partial [Planctomycetes bacterium]|nr:substrate-binding domain-containing protein [Planctomycetota bacterium]
SPVLAVASRLGALAVAGAIAAQTPIAISGSDTMVTLNRELTTRYARLVPSARFVVFGKGSETGIRALLAGETEIAAASRRMTPAETADFEERHGVKPKEIVVALDGIAI